MNLGKNIKHLRQLKGYTQTHMATNMGISQKTYSRIESKGNDINDHYVNEIANILDLSVMELHDLDVVEMVNGRNKVRSRKKEKLPIENVSTLRNRNKLYEELVSTKDKLIVFMRQEIEKLREEKGMHK